MTFYVPYFYCHDFLCPIFLSCCPKTHLQFSVQVEVKVEVDVEVEVEVKVEVEVEVKVKVKVKVKVEVRVKVEVEVVTKQHSIPSQYVHLEYERTTFLELK